METSTTHIPETYAVPQRFGLAALLGMTTLFACLFAILRSVNAPPVIYLFFGSIGSIIGLAQMKMGSSPRMASAIAGAILMPIWLLISALVVEGSLPHLATSVLTLPFAIVGGAFFGYLTGAILAGVFLFVDMASDREKRKSIWGMTRPQFHPPRNAHAVANFPNLPRPVFHTAVVQEREFACAICGAKSLQPLIVAAPAALPVDLDLRPGPPQRSLLPCTIHHCSACGCCVSDLSNPPPAARECIAGKEYRQLLGNESLPILARRFLGAAAIEQASGAHARAFWRCCHAAWACDDEGNGEAGVACRQRAAEQHHRALAAHQSLAGDPAADLILLADLHRRAGDHVAALAACGRAMGALNGNGARQSSGGMLAYVIDFERSRALSHDAGAHTLAEAYGMTPARV